MPIVEIFSNADRSRFFAVPYAFKDQHTASGATEAFTRDAFISNAGNWLVTYFANYRARDVSVRSELYDETPKHDLSAFLAGHDLMRLISSGNTLLVRFNEDVVARLSYPFDKSIAVRLLELFDDN